jgi:hypothetical protein
MALGVIIPILPKLIEASSTTTLQTRRASSACSAVWA